MSHTTLVIIFSLLLLPGLLMAFIPLLPAFWFLFAVALAFSVLDGFTHMTAMNLAALAGIFLLSAIIDLSAGLLGAKLGGAGWRSLLLGLGGGILGFLLLPPLGAFVGLFIGVVLGELHRRRSGTKALQAATGAFLGSIGGAALNIVLAVVFIVLFVFFAIR